MRALLRVLRLALVGALAILLIGASAVAYGWATADLDTRDEVAFDAPLWIPPLAASRIDAEGRRVFDLDVRRGTHESARGSRRPRGV